MSNIFRIKKNENFVVMDKEFLYNKNLSWKAKGILAFMLSKPDDWTFYIDELIKHSTDGERSFRAGFKELSDQGYVKRRPVRKGQRIKRWETIVYENPELCGSLHVQNVQVQNEEVRNLHVQNSSLLNNNNTKNDNTKNDSNIYTIFDHWNNQGIIKHRKLNQSMKSHTNARLQEYTKDELIKAIDNYKEVLDSPNHYWTHKWTLQDFMKPNNVSRFTDDADPLNNYMKSQKQTKNNFIPMEQHYNPEKDAF